MYSRSPGLLLLRVLTFVSPTPRRSACPRYVSTMPWYSTRGIVFSAACWARWIDSSTALVTLRDPSMLSKVFSRGRNVGRRPIRSTRSRNVVTRNPRSEEHTTELQTHGHLV